MFRKRNNISAKTKIFILNGGYPAVRKALFKRGFHLLLLLILLLFLLLLPLLLLLLLFLFQPIGWFENTEVESTIFDLKWVLRMRDIDFPSLSENQLINHFLNTGCFTTKVGLCRNLRNLICFENTDIEEFHPRCFDLNDQKDLEDFVEDYKYNHVNPPPHSSSPSLHPPPLSPPFPSSLHPPTLLFSPPFPSSPPPHSYFNLICSLSQVEGLLKRFVTDENDLKNYNELHIKLSLLILTRKHSNFSNKILHHVLKNNLKFGLHFEAKRLWNTDNK